MNGFEAEQDEILLLIDEYFRCGDAQKDREMIMNSDELSQGAIQRSVRAQTLKQDQYAESGARGAQPYLDPHSRCVDVPLATTRERIQHWIDTSPYEEERLARVAYQEAFESALQQQRSSTISIGDEVRVLAPEFYGHIGVLRVIEAVNETDDHGVQLECPGSYIFFRADELERVCTECEYSSEKEKHNNGKR